MSERLSVAFLNTAGGDRFDSARKFIESRNPSSFAGAVRKSLSQPPTALCLAELPGIGHLNTNVQREAYLSETAASLGPKYHVAYLQSGITAPEQNTLGLGLISKLPVSNIDSLTLDSPVSELTHPKGAVRFTLGLDEGNIDIIAVHYPPLQKVRRIRELSYGELETVTDQNKRFLKFLTPRIDEISKKSVKTVIVGDFNAKEGNDDSLKLIEMLREIGYQEAITEYTIPGSPNQRPDRIFITSDLQIETSSTFDAESDHYGIFASIS